MRIDRCVCYSTPFSEIIKEATPKGWTVDDVEKFLGCGGACGMCRPYIREGLKTGKDHFTEVLREDRTDP